MMLRQLPLRNLIVIGLLVAAITASLPPGSSGPVASAGRQPAAWVHVPDDLGEPERVDAAALAMADPGQTCTPGNLVRLISEDWESPDFPASPAHPKWRSFDDYSPLRGFIDEIEWGRCASEASVGSASAWSVGGGAVGGKLSCQDKAYPVGPDCRSDGGCRINTVLQYYYIDLKTEKSNFGLRVTFDYKAKMPAGAFLLGVGDLDAEPDKDGRIPIYSDPNRPIFPDTSGQWLRGLVANLGFEEIRNKPRVLLVFQYKDDAPNPDSYGILVDNIHIDVMFVENPCLMGSATATIPPTVPTPTLTPTIVRPTIEPPTSTPRRPFPQGFVPLVLKNFRREQVTSVPTAPSPSSTPTPSNTPTLTLTPTLTPTLTLTPTRTPTPTWTPVPVPDVRISLILPTSGNPRNRIEFARLRNQGTGPQSLDGWRLFEATNFTNCRFPAGIVLGPRDEYEVRFGRDAVDGVVNGVDGFVCSADFIWDNNADEGWLYNNFNAVVDRYCYDRDGPFYCPLP